jgi:hypothetical protein
LESPLNPRLLQSVLSSGTVERLKSIARAEVRRRSEPASALFFGAPSSLTKSSSSSSSAAAVRAVLDRVAGHLRNRFDVQQPVRRVRTKLLQESLLCLDCCDAPHGRAMQACNGCGAQWRRWHTSRIELTTVSCTHQLSCRDTGSRTDAKWSLII